MSDILPNDNSQTIVCSKVRRWR